MLKYNESDEKRGTSGSVKRLISMMVLVCIVSLILCSCGEKQPAASNAEGGVRSAEEGGPVDNSGFENQTFTRKETYSWEKTHAKVLPNGNLEWAPLPFVFEKGSSVRYIDYEAGNDGKDGTTKESAWKHHPWDAAATGTAKECKGIHTYVFKRGVAYRGSLKGKESGEPGNPIRLTSDPEWGKGAAGLYGSTKIKGGWKKATAAEAAGIPAPDKVWYIDLGANYDRDNVNSKFTAMFQVDPSKESEAGAGNAERMIIARSPNYDLSDPNDPVKNWPRMKKFKSKTGMLTSPFLKGLGDKNVLDGCVIWLETDNLMGSAARRNVKWDYDPVKGTITSKSFIKKWGMKRISSMRRYVHFMIENVKEFLDAPGEYFFDIAKGRLYVYPAAGVDPNTVVYEVAQRRHPIWIGDQSNIVISGLEFRYNDAYAGVWEWPFDASPAVRLAGACQNITVKNNRFYHVAGVVGAYPHKYIIKGNSQEGVMDNIRVTDNDAHHVEMGQGVTINGDNEGAKGQPWMKLKNADILRNRIVNSGFRHGGLTWAHIPSIEIKYAETCEIAGNIVDTTFGNGIITFGGKGSGGKNVVPLIRYFVHHNQLDNTVLGCNDYGGLEHFQGGPLYIYNNITRNCVGNKTTKRE